MARLFINFAEVSFIAEVDVFESELLVCNSLGIGLLPGNHRLGVSICSLTIVNPAKPGVSDGPGMIAILAYRRSPRLAKRGTVPGKSRAGSPGTSRSAEIRLER